MGITENIDGKNVQVSGRVFTISNFISFSRVFIAFPIIYIHYNNEYQVTPSIIALIVYGVISDYLDGLVARKTNTISELGKIIDPVSDKLCAGILFIYTVWIGWVPLWFMIFFIIRDVLIITGSGFIKVKYGKVAMSTLTGKISVNVLSAYWVSVFFFRDAILAHEILLYCSVAIMVISFFAYINRYRKIMSGAEFN
ncbi:MAG: CDP-alcohol phosphatidyltransferase family protein [Balneolales bacterium]|nr:CDP-alcohol phosphatidyltransferase family protein [Balneolales bacterium]